MKNQIAVMCHNIAKYNREHKMPDLTPLEAAKELDIVDQEYSMDPRYIDSRKMYAVHSAITYLRAIAAGEYKPVVHARWKLVSEGAQCNLVKCTHCGRLIAVARNVPLDEWRAAKPYCDQCGALMHKSDMGILQDGKDDSHE